MNSLNFVKKLLEERKEREEFKVKVFAALEKQYEFRPIEDMAARECALVSNVQAYLAVVLGVPENNTFRRRVLQALSDSGLVKIVSQSGYSWIKGLVGLPPDKVVADKVIEQHYRDRENYRKRQREHGKKRLNATG